jgi:cation:H+ antiporter
VAVELLVFVVATAAALVASHLLIVRLERIGARLSLAEAALGIVAALAADTPEIVTAATALVRHQNDVGVGVILGSNVAKFALLLGLAAIVSGRIRLDPRVVVLEGLVAGWLAVVALGLVTEVVSPAPAFLLSLLVFVPYVVVSAVHPDVRGRLPVPARLRGTLSRALEQEEDDLDLETTTPASSIDVVAAVAVLAVVIVASVLVERSATDLGTRWGLSDLVVGAVVLAIVTSVPNAVAAVHLARRGRGAATLSTTTNSNNINVIVGLLLPAVVVGMGQVTASATLTAWWYLVLTVVVLGWTWVRRGLGRVDGALVCLAYVAFLVALLR